MRTMKGVGVYRGADLKRKRPYWLSILQDDGRRPKQWFATEKERDRMYDQRVRELQTMGRVSLVEITPRDRLLLAEVKRLSARAGVTPMALFERGLANVGTGFGDLKFKDAAEQFLAEQTLRREEQKIGPIRFKEIRNMVARFVGDFGNATLAELTRTYVKTYLLRLKVGPQTRRNVARNLAFVLGWCVDEGMIASNPVPEQTGVARIPAVFGNAEVEELFEAALGNFPNLIPMLAVQWYAGLRPGASHNLTWECVDFERGRILIQPHGNKLRQPDIVQDLPPSVFGWLAPHRLPEGPIAPASHVEINKALHHMLGYTMKPKDGGKPKRWPEDVARHTFASNLFSLYEQDFKRVEAVMLHSTSRMLRQHYLVKNVPRESACAYFSRYTPRAST